MRTISVNQIKKGEGFILMISLWILALIAMLSLGLAHRVAINIKLSSFKEDRLKVHYAAKAAVHKAIAVLENELKDNPQRPHMLNQIWSLGYDVTQTEMNYLLKDVSVGDAFFTVKAHDGTGLIRDNAMTDEDRKININDASRELLRALFEVLEADDPQALADAIIYWRGDALGEHDSYYGSVQIPYEPLFVPFQAIEELTLVKGFRGNKELLAQCYKYLSVFPSAININTATSDVLQAVFLSLGAQKDFADRLASNIIVFRNGIDNQAETKDDVPIAQATIKTVLKTGLVTATEITWVDNQVFPFTAYSQWFRIEAEAWLSSGSTRKKVSVVVDKDSGYRIVYWHEI